MPVQVLVSDTSVLVDLERGGLLEASFRLPFQFAVPDLLFERELRGYGGEELLQKGLVVAELDDKGVELAIAYRRRAPVLSLPDGFALALAQTRDWVLLTGDGALRRLAVDEDVDCHGVLWVLDQMHEASAATVKALHDGLTAISDHPRCRLPRAEIRRRLTLYAAGLE